MRERPLICDKLTVKAILEGRKTQTRRPMKKQPANFSSVRLLQQPTKMIEQKPFCEVGDILWVRETLFCNNDTDGDDYSTWDCGSTLELGPEYAAIDYLATPACYDPPTCEFDQTVTKYEGPVIYGAWWLAPPDGWDGKSDYWKTGNWQFLPKSPFTKHAAIHCPRWAARIFLKVTDIRAEQVRDITEEDAKAEGMLPQQFIFDQIGGYAGPTALTFAEFFDEKYNKRGLGWDENPWVWVVTFERVEDYETEKEKEN